MFHLINLLFLSLNRPCGDHCDVRYNMSNVPHHCYYLEANCVFSAALHCLLWIIRVALFLGMPNKGPQWGLASPSLRTSRPYRNVCMALWHLQEAILRAPEQSLP